MNDLHLEEGAKNREGERDTEKYREIKRERKEREIEKEGIPLNPFMFMKMGGNGMR